MRSSKPQMIIMLSGALLIAIGIAAVCFQGYMEIMSPKPFQPPPQSLNANPNQFSITTRFPGLELVIIGAVLEIVGYLGVRPWKDSPPAS